MTTHKIKIGDTWFPVNEVIAVVGGGGVTAHGLLSGLDADGHTQYLNNARGDARYDAIGTADAGDTAHVGASNPHPEYLTPAEGNAAYDAIGTADAGDTAHVGASNPHPEYLTPAEGNAAYDAIGTASNSVTAHHAASSTDHDDRYYTEGEVDGRLATKENQGTASALDNSHVGAADPHTGYLLKAGGTMTGVLKVQATGTSPLIVERVGRPGVVLAPQADNSLGVLRESDLAFTQVRAGMPVDSSDVTTKAYVDGLESVSFNLVPSWTVYGGAYSTILLQKSADKMVTLEGLITPVTPSVAVGAGATITVGSLPAGYAPATQILIPALMADYSSTVAIATRIQISVNGDLIFTIPRDAPSINWVSLSFSFRAA